MESSDSLYNELLSGNPSQGTYLKVLSRMRKEGMIEKAINECAKALELYPDDIGIRRLLAETCLEAGDIARAESEIREVVARINGLMSCYRFQADLFIRQGKNAEAVESLKLYLIHCPDDKEGYALLESMLPGDESHAEPPHEEGAAGYPVEEHAESAAQTPEPELPEIATATLAEVYFRQGMTEEAIEIYEKVVELNPNDSGSSQRLEELKAMSEQARLAEEKEQARLIRKKKMVSILESWLEGIREQSKPGLSAG